MAPPAANSSGPSPLVKAIDTALAAVGGFESTLLTIMRATDDTDEEHAKSPSDIKNIGLVVDASRLLEARMIQLYYMITHDPFTPSAIIKILDELTNTIMGGLCVGALAYDSKFYTLTYRHMIASSAAHLLRETRTVLRLVPRDGQILRIGEKTRAEKSVGVIKSECKVLKGFVSKGVAYALTTKIEDIRDLVKDVTVELRQWKEDSEQTTGDFSDEEDPVNPEDEIDDLHGNDLNTVAQSLIDHMLDEPMLIPRNDPQRIGERVDMSIRRLKLTALLCDALIKRRMNTLGTMPSTTDAPSRLDRMLEVLHRLPKRTEDLAVSFYGLNKLKIDWNMDQIALDTHAVTEIMEKSWEGKEDEFTAWAKRFQKEIQSA